ncbi:hypothetical protein [Actinophytocola algeriensis]|uniref:Uncharacterized protein n=1 Tax=Actinophytocola algeriensis TaxID=1768010 RepID=A0A7W7VGR8_9PSEU|nr:hypothetical protein [Actinophytocola algeriensis]MBB4909628.1 hypothetical protein [Actinophytocola algeriensis]MBE1475618.1 hypothetical protein [Actinophytocola algeriensis]
MASLTALYQALPISSEHIRVGSQSGCGGIAAARIDLAAAQTYEFVDATPPPRENDMYEDQELVDFCVTNVREGIEEEFYALFGKLPTVRVVLHKVLPHAVDSNEMINRHAGRTVVRLALRNVGLDDVPSPTSSHKVIRPRPTGSSSGTT